MYGLGNLGTSRDKIHLWLVHECLPRCLLSFEVLLIPKATTHILNCDLRLISNLNGVAWGSFSTHQHES